MTPSATPAPVSAITETEEFNSARYLASGHIEVRIDTVIRRGDVEISREPHRHVVSPGDDLASERPEVAGIATANWTPEIIAAYEAKRAALTAQAGPQP